MGRAVLASQGLHPGWTTELGVLATLAPEFERRGVRVIGLSVDSLDAHREWSKDILAVTGAAPNFPMIADHDRRIAMLYGMLDPQAGDTATVRSVFVIGPDKRVKLTLTYPASTGTQLRRTAAHDRLPAADRGTPGGDARQLAARETTSSSPLGSPTPPPASATLQAGARPRRISATRRRPKAHRGAADSRQIF